MNERYRGVYVGLLTVLLALAGCKPKPPVINLADIQLRSISRDAVGLNVDFKVFNPNGYDIRLRGLDFDMNAGGTKLAGGQVVGAIPAIAAREWTRVSTALDISLPETLSVVKRLAKDREIAYVLKGEAVFDVLGFDLPVKVDKSGRIALMQML
ncbi:unnamed protein product, partial [marine sediment metagenome]